MFKRTKPYGVMLSCTWACTTRHNTSLWCKKMLGTTAVQDRQALQLPGLQITCSSGVKLQSLKAAPAHFPASPALLFAEHTWSS